MNERCLCNAATDREISLRRLAGNEQLLATLAEFFLEDAPIAMQQLDDAYQLGELATVAHRANYLRGLASTFEAKPFQEIASQIEDLAQSGQRIAIHHKLWILRIEFSRLISALHSVKSA